MGRLDDAINSYREAIRLKPDYAEAYSNLGNKLSKEESIFSHRKALVLKPESSNPNFNLGVAFYALNKKKKAVSSYTKARIIDPYNLQCLANLGGALHDIGKHQKALVELRRAIEINPKDFACNNNIANTLKSLSLNQEAAHHYKQLKTKKGIAQSLECLYEAERFEEVSAGLEELFKTDKSNIRAAALGAFVASQLNQENKYPFCNEPLKFFYHANLRAHKNNLDEFIDEVISEINTNELAWEPKNKTTRNGFQTLDNLFPAKTPSLKILEKHIRREIETFRYTFENETDELFRSWPGAYDLKAWFVKLMKGGYQDAHIHPSGWISGVIYLKTVEEEEANEGALELSLHGYGYRVINEDYPRLVFQPKNGDIILFPSSVFHRTIPFQRSNERCVIAFDMTSPIK